MYDRLGAGLYDYKIGPAKKTLEPCLCSQLEKKFQSSFFSTTCNPSEIDQIIRMSFLNTFSVEKMLCFHGGCEAQCPENRLGSQDVYANLPKANIVRL